MLRPFQVVKAACAGLVLALLVGFVAGNGNPSHTCPPTGSCLTPPGSGFAWKIALTGGGLTLTALMTICGIVAVVDRLRAQRR
jgi:hypothetical protein